MDKRRKKKGFTLIEMIVVLAIIGILAAIAVPQALKSINKSKATTDIANAKTIANALLTGVAENTITLISDTNFHKIDTTSISGITNYLNPVPVPKALVPSTNQSTAYFYKYTDSNNYLEIYASLVDASGNQTGTAYRLYPSVDTSGSGNPYNK